jgi:SAM-dependent methyltransferase
LIEMLDIRGKRVLDVGANEGFFSQYLAEQGAEVLGIDVDEHRIEKARFVQSLLQRPNVDFRVLDIYSPDFAGLPSFDFCLCMGFLHRIPDPVTALSALAERCSLILLEWKALKAGPHDDAFAYFTPKPVDREDYYGTEYWLLSYSAVERILRRLGFTHFHRVDDPRQRRALLVAGKADNRLFELPDVILHAGRFRALLRHTKRYLQTVGGIVTGRVNA